MAGEAAGASTSIRVSTSFSVNPSSRESWETLTSPFLLGPLDLVPSYIPIAVVYVYARPANSDSELISFERLHLALQRLLNYYPHLSGRIQINPNDHTPEISRLGTGAELVAAQCSSPLSAFHSTSPSPSPSLSLLDLPRAANDLLPSFDSSPEGVCRKPLLTIQHTSFACGGVALGVRVRHCLCDAQEHLSLPPRYFPNALATRTTTLSSLADAPLSEIAKSIHDLLQSPPDVTEETLKWMAAQPDKDRIQDQFRYSEWSFMLSAWSKFDIYGGSRFEVKPILVAPPFTAISNLDGLGYLLPAAPGAEREKGAIELYLALSEPVWALLEENGGFRLEG
ncbi:hypothetical protein RQP46_009833 [Phenoliferia psychrophenolica]